MSSAFPHSKESVPRTIVAAQHLGLFAAEWKLPPGVGEGPREGSGKQIVFVLGGTVEAGTCARSLGWVESGEGMLVSEPVRLQSGKVAAHGISWTFPPSLLPEAVRVWAERITAGGAVAAFRLTPSLRAVLDGTLACPVPAVLREHWALAKLLELMTLVVAEVCPEAGTAPPVHHPAIQSALAFMRAELGQDLTLDSIAAAARTSPSHLSRLFSAEFGCGPTHYLRSLRMEEAARVLRSGRRNVTEVCFDLGYGSLAQFSRAFRAHHGRSPSAFIPRRGTR